MSASTEKTDTVIVGGGQSGLALSYLLTEQSRDHIVLEKRHRVGETWRQRWDSFTLVTPNWHLRLPGHCYEGSDPDGFTPREGVVGYLEAYANLFEPPVRFGANVTGVHRLDDGYVVTVEDDIYEARNVVVAAGTFQRPRIHSSASRIPPSITQLHTAQYRNPAQLPPGPALVVGSGQSGAQIALELMESGRQVYLCVGSAGRLPRRYRQRDGMWWALQLGMLDQTVDELDSPDERFRANPQISGRNGGSDINLHEFARAGMRLLGHLNDVANGHVLLAGDLHDNLAMADTMAGRFREGVDAYVTSTGLDVPEEVVNEPTDGYEQEIQRDLNLEEASIGSIIWATGYQWDYSWVDVPVFDDRGYPIQDRGVTASPGLYFLGLHWLHTLKSGLFLGVGDDAADVAAHMARRDGVARPA